MPETILYEQQIDNLRKSIIELELELKKLNKQEAEQAAALAAAKKGTDDYNNKLKELTNTKTKIENLEKNSILTSTRLNLQQQLYAKTLNLTEGELKALLSTLQSVTQIESVNTAQIINATNALKTYEMMSKQASKAQIVMGQTQSAMGKRVKDTNYLNLQMNQVMREMPNFALSARIGLMSLTNNLPYLGEALTNATEKAKANGEQVTRLTMLWKTFKSSLSGLNGALLLITVAMAALTNTKIREFFKNLFTGAKDATDALNETSTAVEKIAEAFKDGNTEYGKAIKNITELKIILEAAKKGTIDHDRALEAYNSTLGDTLGVASSITEAYDTLISQSEELLAVTLQLTIIEALKNELSEEYVRMAKLQYATERQLYDAKFLNTEATEEEEKAADKAYKKILSQREELREQNETYYKEFIFFQDVLAKKRQEGADEDSIGVSQIALDGAKRRYEKANQALADFETKQKETTERIRKDEIKESQGQFDLYVSFLEESLRKVLTKSRSSKFLPLPDEKEIKESITKFREKYNRIIEDESKKLLPYNLELLDEQYNFNQEQQELFNYLIEVNENFWGETVNGRLKFNKKINEARRDDLKLEVLENEAQIEANNWLLKKQVESWEKRNKEAVDGINKDKEERDKHINLVNVYNQEISRLEEELANEDNAKLKQQIEDKIGLRKKGLNREKAIVLQYDKSIKEKEDKVKDLEKEAKGLEKLSKDSDDLEKRIIEIYAEIFNLNLEITQNRKDLLLNQIEDVREYVDAIGDLFGGLSSYYEANMDAENEKYDRKKEIAEDTIENEEELNKRLQEIEVERYNALKKDFERNKKIKEAEAWMNFASGAIGIWTKNYESKESITATILSALQTAALLATTIANVKKIRSQKLEAPSPAGSTASPSTSIPLEPSKQSLTSPQENLNTQRAQKSQQAWVRVSEINNVQNKVGVREANQTF